MSNHKNLSFIDQKGSNSVFLLQQMIESYLKDSKMGSVETLKELIASLELMIVLYSKRLSDAEQHQQMDLQKRFTRGYRRKTYIEDEDALQLYEEEPIGPVIQRLRKKIGLSTYGVVRKINDKDFGLHELRILEMNNVLPSDDIMAKIASMLDVCKDELDRISELS